MSAYSAVNHNPSSIIELKQRRRPILPNPVFGMLIFVVSEVMFFAALISALLVIKAQRTVEWTTPQNVTLPVFATAFNTMILFLSGGFLYFAGKYFANEQTRYRTKATFLRAILLGSFFVLFQGYEWLKLINYGMTMTSGIFGACFFLIIGTHGLHAFFSIIAMLVLYYRLSQNRLSLPQLQAMQIFWYFVVGIWPILYGLVYF